MWMIMVGSMASLSMAQVNEYRPRQVQRPVSYPVAYDALEAGEAPMVVVVGGPWCSGCETAKRSVIEPMLSAGEFAGANVVYLDPRDPVTSNDAYQVLRQIQESTVPRVVIYSRSVNGQYTRDRCNPITRHGLRTYVARALRNMGR